MAGYGGSTAKPMPAFCVNRAISRIPRAEAGVQIPPGVFRASSSRHTAASTIILEVDP